MLTMKIKVDGMMCAHCASHVEKALKELKGVKKAEVGLKEGTATIESKAPLEEGAIKAAIEEAGYKFAGKI